MTSESRRSYENLRFSAANVSSGLGKLTALALVVLVACDAITPPPERPDAGGGFDDRTVGSVGSPDEYLALAAEGPGRQSLKFVITGFETPGLRTMRYMDGRFYTLHDEWYWFRLLNGERIPGLGTDPVTGLEFDSIAAIYQWAETQASLPLELQLGGGRLYSSRFYDLALSRPRFFGLGSLMRIARDGEPVRWLFELEYSHVVSHQELVIIFEMLEATLPADIASDLAWVVRSPQQETEAKRIEQAGLRYHDRIVRYSELAVPGETEVYSAGLTAGRVKVFKDGESLGSAQEGHVLFLSWVPDYLPPAAGLITAVPQTPLAHVNVLARNRGIPNAYLGGLLDDPSIDQLDRVQAPVIVRATAPDMLEVLPISENEYVTWLQLRAPAIASVPQVDVPRLPLTIDLADYTLQDIDEVRPMVGGKAAGFLALLAPGTVTVPDRPMAITIRPYVEHMASFDGIIDAMMADVGFRTAARIRYLVLEGPNRFDTRYPSPADAAVKTQFFDDRGPGHPIGDLARQGGLKNAIRGKAIDAATLDAILTVLRAHFAGYAVDQGLRFRSSSTVEDIEGFNGAGLYDSNTGFVEHAMQANARDKTRSVERAILRTWSSYWAFEAFEERRLETIDHDTGNMGVLVHARFDDDKELANGVLTFTLLPDGHSNEAELEMNVQLGAVSVTNPVPGSGALPEVDRLVLVRGTAAPSIVRVRPSTLVTPPQVLLSDAQLLSIFEQARAVTEAALAQKNRDRDATKAQRTLTLDFEMKHMAEGWPSFVQGPPLPQRIVIKQARSLDPGLRKVSPLLYDLPLPVDVMARARRIQRWTCAGDVVTITVVEALTDPLSPPDLGYSELPFTGSVNLAFTADVPELQLAAGAVVDVAHPDIARSDHRGLEAGQGWDLDVELEATAAAALGLTRVRIGTDRALILEHGAARHDSAALACTDELLHSAPEDYLLQLLTR